MLTDVQLRRLTPREKPYKLSDTGGLFIFVQSSGSRLWRMKYRFGGKEKLLSFGTYPEVTLAAAREARDQARVELRAGRDPSLTRRQRQAEAKRVDKQLQHVGEEWMKAQSARWTPRHAEDVRASLERLAWPDLGHIDLDEITAPMVLETIKKIEARRAKETARRVRQRLSAIFLFGMAHGLGRHDPASVIKGALAPLIKGRQPALIDLEELKHLFHQVELIPAHPVTMLALRFLALTVVRPGEVHAIGWHELSEDKSFWIIPAERMKIRREHVVPLSRQAQEILQAVSVLTGKGPLADLPDETEEVIGDRGYDSNRIRLSLAERNITACILPRKNRKSKPPYNWNLYKKRHLIENMFAKLKDWRRVATRYERCAHTFMSAIHIAASFIFYLKE